MGIKKANSLTSPLTVTVTVDGRGQADLGLKLTKLKVGRLKEKDYFYSTSA